MPQERLTVRKIKEIMRLKYEVGLSNRAIAGACKVSNSTVGEYLRRARSAGIGWPLNEIGEEELYAKLFPDKNIIQKERNPEMPDWEEVQKEKRQKGVTLQLLWQEYKEKNPEGYQYSQYCYHYQQWRKRQVEPAFRFEHKGGEQMQVDYTGVKIPVTDPQTGEIKKASVFVAILPASNYIYAEAQPSENQCNWNNAHVRALEYFGGVMKIVVPDNLKTGVTKPNYYEPDINPAYQELAEYYQFAVLPARVRKPRDKGPAENGVQNVERWIIAPLRKRQFFSVSEVNEAIKELLEKLNNKPMKTNGKSRREEFNEIDFPNLRPLPVQRYEYAERKTAKVNLDYHIEFEKHFYSVPYTLIHQQVEIRATERMVEIFHKGISVANHPRSFQQGRYSTIREHMPPNHQFMKNLNADRFIQWANAIGPQTTQLVTALLKSRTYPEQTYRTCLGILGLSKNYPYPLMEQACQVALEAKVFSYKAIKQELNLLQKQEPQSTDETLPSHENIRGTDYYKERTLS
ncbi:MAG: IS21 family transposase [Labilibaculum sp.]|nr:IS21 family transposase [Labilibaculum sp.]MBI9060328.1 IS21 family transposase [Labilibaculum sp.]